MREKSRGNELKGCLDELRESINYGIREPDKLLCMAAPDYRLTGHEALNYSILSEQIVFSWHGL
jgi:hypothetical protein